MNFRRQKICAALFFLLLLPFSACANDAEPVAVTQQQMEMFARANSLFQQGQFAEIIPLLRDLVEKTERPHPYACVMYGLACMRMGENKKAVEIFRKGIATSPSYTALHLNMGVALLQDEKHEAAGNSFLKASTLEKGSDAITYAYTAAQCYHLANLYSRSMDALGRVLKQSPPKAEWLRLAAANCIQIPRWKEAEQYFARLTEMEPGTRQHWKGLAYARMRQGNDAGSAAALEIASRLPGTAASERKELSGMYRRAMAPLLSLEVEKLLPANSEQEKITISSLMRANRQAELLRYLDRLLAKKSTSELLLLKGVVLYRRGNLAEAIVTFALGGKSSGKDAERCRLLEGMAAWEQGDWLRAKKALTPVAAGGSAYKQQAIQGIAAIEAMEELQRELHAMSAYSSL